MMGYLSGHETRPWTDVLVEARAWNHLGKEEDLSCHRHPAVTLGPALETRTHSGDEVISMRFVRRLTTVSALIVISACGGSSNGESGSVNQKYADFCILAADLDTQSKGTHGEDPTAISDPTAMKAAWATITASAIKLRDAAPSIVRDDVTTLVDSILAMNKVFESYKYNLLEMSHVPAVNEELGKISRGDEVTAASTRFRSFMQKNCGEPSS